MINDDIPILSYNDKGGTRNRYKTAPKAVEGVQYPVYVAPQYSIPQIEIILTKNKLSCWKSLIMNQQIYNDKIMFWA